MPNTAWQVMAHSSKHTLSTVAGFVLALQGSGKPEVPNLMIPLRRQLPQPISAASGFVLRALQNIHWATKQLSAYCDIRFFLLLGTFKSPDTTMVGVCCSGLVQSVHQGAIRQSIPQKTATSVIKVFHGNQLPLPGSGQTSTHLILSPL